MSHFTYQTGLKLQAILLLQAPECPEYSHIPPWPVSFLLWLILIHLSASEIEHALIIIPLDFPLQIFLFITLPVFLTIFSTFLVFMITFSISSYYLIGRVILLICFALYFIFKTDFIELQTSLCILRTKWCFLPDCHSCLLYPHRLPSFIVCPEISYIFLLDFLKSSLWIFFCP